MSAAMVVSAILGYMWSSKRDTWKVGMAVENLSTTVKAQSAKIEELAQFFIAAAKYEERFVSHQRQLDRIQDEVDGLKRGEGYINAR